MATEQPNGDPQTPDETIANPPRERFRIRGHVPAAVHVYHDKTGAPVGLVARFVAGTLDAKKTFRAYRFRDGRWLSGLDGIQLPLYRLPAIVAAAQSGALVFCCEGEKCADRLVAEGFVATTSPGGAGHWRDQHSEELRGADVAFLADNDEAGRLHARQGANGCTDVTKRVRLLEFSDLPESGDVVDWLDAGHSVAELLTLIEALPDWTPSVQVAEEWAKPQPFAVSTVAEPFPLAKALPPFLGELAEAIAESVRVDVTAPAVLIPAAISAAAGNAYSVRASRSYAEPCVARYVLWGADPGERKSATFRKVTDPLDHWVAKEMPLYLKRRENVLHHNSAYSARLRAAEGRFGRAKTEHDRQKATTDMAEARSKLLSEPREPLTYSGDITAPMLVRTMNKNGGAHAAFSGDARHLIDAVLGQHRRDRKRDDSAFLLAHAGDLMDRARIGATPEGESFTIPHPSLALALCVQPDKLSELGSCSDLSSSGFLARCNIVRPLSLIGTRFETGEELELSSSLRDRWRLIGERLLKARFRLVDAQRDAPFEPLELALGPEAMESRRALHNTTEARQKRGHDLAGATGFASKFCGEAVRLAGLFFLADLASENVLDDAGPGAAIPPDLWEYAEAHQTWQLGETLRVLGIAQEAQEEKLAREILRWVSEAPGERRTVAARDLVTARKVATVLDAETVLDRLVAYGWARELAPQGRESKPRWTFHPSALKRLAA